LPTHRELATAAPWVQVSTDAEDWASADADVLLQLLGRAQWIRSFEEYVLELAGQSLIHWPARR
jgi:2-oxoisovalerate dehydrogenase E1 component